MKKLYRSLDNRILAGVCGGLAERFHADPMVVRLGIIFFSAAFGLLPAVAITYIAGWIILPEGPPEG